MRHIVGIASHRDGFPEVRVLQSLTLSIGERIGQIAIGYEIAIVIVPRPHDAIDRSRHRVGEARERRQARADHEASKVRLEGSLPIAKQVV